MTLRSMVIFARERVPHQLAVVEGETRQTYSELTDNVYALANSLLELGVKHGDRIAVGMRNSANHITVFLALQMLGAVAIPFNFRLKPPSVVWAVQDSDAKMLITNDASLKVAVEQIAPDLGLVWIIAEEPAIEGAFQMEDLVRDGSRDEPKAEVGYDDLSAILYTSGTTGVPKGVPIDHRTSYARFLPHIAGWGPQYNSGVRVLAAPPMYHSAGLHSVLCMTLFLNGTCYPVRDFEPTEAMQLIARERITLLYGSPTLLHMLLSAPDTNKLDLSSVTGIYFGSAAMPPSRLGEVERRFTSATIIEIYGTTEAGLTFLTVNAAATKKTGALKLAADQRARVIRPGGSPDEILPAGEEGELIVDMSNEGSFHGYWRRPDQDAARIRNGWYYTGDAFVRDADGDFFINGRVDDVFISGAENIQPLEVEIALSGHPGIADVAVIGTPHELWGEAVTAIVAKRDPALTEEDIDLFCRTSALDDFKRPRRVFFVDEIPRNPSGKVVRKELRAQYLEHVVESADRA